MNKKRRLMSSLLALLMTGMLCLPAMVPAAVHAAQEETAPAISQENADSAASQKDAVLAISQEEVIPDASQNASGLSVSAAESTAAPKELVFETGSDASLDYSPYLLYTGETLVPELTIQDGSYTLVEGTDYELTLPDESVEMGAYSLHVAFTGAYTGELDLDYFIQGNMQDAEVEGISEAVYTGKELTQDLAVTLYGKKLVEGEDYILSYSDNVYGKNGNGTVTIAGVPDHGYAGELSKEFPIRIDLSTEEAKLSVGKIASLVYTGKQQKPLPVVKAVGAIGKVVTLKKDKDYTLSYKNNINKGTASVVIKGIGAYQGTYKKTFQITAKEVTPAVTLSKTSYTWDNKVKRPAVKEVKVGSKVLEDGYKVSYAKDRKNIGAYKVTVTLTGNYTGSKSVSFRINPKGTSLKSVSAGKKKAAVKWTKQVEKTSGYQLRYSTSSTFASGVKKKKVSGAGKTSVTLSDLSGGRKYYVQIRTYTETGGKTYYSGWSKSKTVTPLPESVAVSDPKAEEQIDARAREILAGMSLEEKVGQMFLAEVSPDNAKTLIGKYHLGGVLLLKNSFSGKSKKTVTSTISSYQKKSDINMLVAVDEEGGTVVRASAFKALRKTPFQSPRTVYQNGGWTKIKSDAKEKAKFLKGLGINTNLAPVADLPANKKSYIYKRSFSSDPQKTARYIKTVVKEFNSQKEVSTLKHFPGYGGNADTHTSVVYDRRKLKTLEKNDMVPFKAGIQEGVPMVMVKHTVVTSLDKKWPASLSQTMHNYLRSTMGFDGVIVTDSLTMDAPQKWVGNNGKVAVRAVQAGNDLLCTNNVKGQYEAVLKAAKDGTIKKSRIDESVLRILKMKLRMGIIK